ncbi:AraC family transcriptional regulator [Anaerofustis stercorihominis]|uniref:AraC family transcriptional regulator n=1 Tax=Anaerofustis stercorihominis TaxID=214853 RepID=UPI00214CAD2E|nr:AraC family transcriptional regulator [Anaerofustis stercorihominis]MCR2032660.1 AraC family transcriptional regulator [Anaerofustis stercorihominis]
MNDRKIIFDKTLNIEAYIFSNGTQDFPNHFHDHYVIGLINEGNRTLTYGEKKYYIKSDDMILFNSYDNHDCRNEDNSLLKYIAVNIPKQSMEYLTYIIKDKNTLKFKYPIIKDMGLAKQFIKVHDMIMENENEMEREELFILFMDELIDKYSKYKSLEITNENIKIQTIENYIKENYDKIISLDILSEISGFNKYSVIRSFTKIKGITPYRYIETIRINKSKELLKFNNDIVEVALKLGFTDQSHFTKTFKKLTGLTPGEYKNIFK